jgi:ligand-binding sensor domain-containing protein
MSDLPDCPAYVGTGAEPDDLEWTQVQAWNVAAIVEDGAGRIWMGGADDDVPELGGKGLYLWDATLPLGAVETFEQGQAPTVPLSSGGITDLAVDAAGKLWIAHREDGVDIWSFGADPRDGIGDRWRHLEDSTVEDDPDFITSREVLSLAADGSRVWIGTTNGVTLYEADSLRGWWFGSTLGSPVIRSLAVTEDHSAWAGTTDGLVRFTPNAVGTFDLEHHRFPDLSSDDIHEIATEGNTVWLATRRGITRGEPVATETAGRARGIGYPNPFRAGAHDGVRLLDVAVAVDGEVYDAAGARVATFRGVGPGEVVWNGRIENGRGGQGLAAPGIYTIVARSGDLTVTTSIAFVR